MNFICDWKNIERRIVWSGVPYGLLMSLEKKINVIDVPIMDNKCEAIIKSFQRRIDKRMGTEFLYNLEIYFGERYINELSLKKGIPSLLFGEYVTNQIENSYVYQDSSVDYNVHMWRDNPALAQYSPMPVKISDREVALRLKKTQEFYRNCKGVFTMSSWLRKYMIGNMGINENKVHFVGGGCNVDTAKISLAKKERKRFLFVGSDWKRKNGPLVVEAFLKLSKKYKDVELYVVCSENISKNLESKNNIKYLGKVTYEKLAELYNLCDYFVMPSRFEAYGIVFAEALIYGLPCIGKNCCEMPEFISNGENGYLIENNDVDELVSCMERLIINNELLVNNVRFKHEEYMRRYSWDAVAERIIRVFINDGYFNN